MKRNKMKCLFLALATLIVVAGAFLIGWNLGSSKGFEGYSWGYDHGTYHTINNADIWQDEEGSYYLDIEGQVYIYE